MGAQSPMIFVCQGEDSPQLNQNVAQQPNEAINTNHLIVIVPLRWD